MGMPAELFSLLQSAPPVAWYPFCEDSHTTGYTPNCSNETDGATLSLALTNFGIGDSCGGGLLTTLDGPGGHLLSGLQSALQLKNDLTLVIFHKSIDSLERRFLLLCTNGNPDTNSTEANNPNYCIAIGVDNHLLCLHESGNGVEAVNTVDTGFVISNADTVSRTIVVKRNATAKTYMASVDGSAFSSGTYQFAPTGGTTCKLNLPLAVVPQADGQSRNVMIFDRQLTDDEISIILTAGNPSADWFDYSNWNGTAGTGYVLWVPATKTHTVVIENGLIQSWDIADGGSLPATPNTHEVVMENGLIKEWNITSGGSRPSPSNNHSVSILKGLVQSWAIT